LNEINNDSLTQPEILVGWGPKWKILWC